MVVRSRGRVLLGRRARGAYAGLWCVPCGYVEWGEDVREAARRELREETSLEAEGLSLLAVHSNFHDPGRLTVGVWFRARGVRGVPRAGDDLDEVAFFPLDDLPPLAFPTDRLVLDALRRSRGRPRTKAPSGVRRPRARGRPGRGPHR
ncbi:MAG: hypothetical protein KatS3mg076_2299 [Candidatus Binatia bacterium]|nr:MAG: hypothetical protein KatS3mg076_2299 [Candidatus Binatia bacterium]